MNCAELFVKCLENEGVERVFGIPGEETLELIEALAHSPLSFIPCRHEQGAAFMADIHGRLTGQAGVCLATLGPGATNLVTGVADANLDHAPLVAVAGQAATNRLHKESHQVLDLVRMFSPVTKYSARILEPGTVTEVTRKAFLLARTEKKGACFIEFPENIAAHPVEDVPLPALDPHLPCAGDQEIREAARLISEASSPLVLAGNGVVRSRASQALRSFAEQLHLPVTTTFMAKGALPASHPLSLGSAGLQARDYVSCGFQEADLIICVGYDLVEYHPYLWHPDRDRRILHLDLAPPEIDKCYTPALSLVGDLADSLGRLTRIATPHQGQVMRPLREALLRELEETGRDPGFPLKPQRIVRDLRDALAPEDIVICDVGAHKLWMARMFPCEHPNTCLISNGFASMGIAVPGAVAAKLARPDRTVVAVTGDGGFLMNVQELETATRLGLSLVVLIWTDNGYGLIDWKQRNRFGHSTFTRFTNPDLTTLARAFGASGVRIGHADDLRPALETARERRGVTIIDCPVDYRENLRLTERLGEMVCPI